MVVDVSSRGQTEPIAALVAVVAVCLAVTVYAGALADVFPTLESERSVEEATAERVWAAISDDAVLEAPDRSGDVSVPVGALPQGYYVALRVSLVGDSGRLTSVASAQFGPGGDRVDVEPPPDGDRVERPVAVRTRPARVRPGRLRVVVWQ